MIRCLFLLLGIASSSFGLSSQVSRKVAVIGTTGTLGREAVLQLVRQGIPVKCLLRHSITGVTPPASLTEATNSTQIAAYLATLPGVEMIQGDITNVETLKELLTDCTDCLALHGATAPKPWFKALIPWAYPESTPTHPKQVNYVGVQNLIAALEESDTCQRVVRITGKGEEPFSFFSILINLLGGMAKAWNNQAEGLLRESSIDYTIIRPGIMMEQVKGGLDRLALKDNGGDLKTSAVSYSQIASLCIQSLDYNQCKRSTLTAMNVADGAESYQPLLGQIKGDSREFPDLFHQHELATRLGGVTLFVLLIFIVKKVASGLLGFLALVVR